MILSGWNIFSCSEGPQKLLCQLRKCIHFYQKDFFLKDDFQVVSFMMLMMTSSFNKSVLVFLVVIRQSEQRQEVFSFTPRFSYSFFSIAR